MSAEDLIRELRQVTTPEPVTPDVMLSGTPAGHVVALPRDVRRILGRLSRPDAEAVYLWCCSQVDDAYELAADTGAEVAAPPAVD